MLRSRRSVVIRFAVSLAVFVLLATGCDTASKPLELTADDNGSTQQLAIGQELRITLESNQTTGYRWAVDGDVPTQLTQADEPTYSSESKIIGAGGQEVWTFEGAQTGSGLLKLKYWRSFEPTAQPAETFTVTVNVK
jgi:inhibitor of cysteine peptidase